MLQPKQSAGRRQTSPPLPALPLRCLTPLEGTLSTEADLSARNVAHRCPEIFTEMVTKSTWLLKKALTTSNGNSNSYVSTASALKLAPTASASTAESSSPISAITKSKRSASTKFTRGYALHRLHEYSKAIDDYNDCTLSEPTHAPTYYNRGCALYALGRREDAVKDFTKALKLDNKNMLYIESRAIVLKELGRFRDAIQDYVWLETLRRTPLLSYTSIDGENIGQRHTDDHGGEFQATTPNGSFSMSFAELSAEASSHSDSSKILDDRRGYHQENAVVEWFLRFLNKKLETRTEEEIDEAMQHVKTWSCFRGMHTDMIRECLAEATYCHFDADQCVAQQGTFSDDFHIVLSDAASLVKNIDVHGTSKLRELKTMCQGDAIGLEPYGAQFADGTLKIMGNTALSFRPRSRRFSRATAVSSAALASTKPPAHMLTRRSSISVAMMEEMAIANDSDEPENDHIRALFPKEPATFTCMHELHCLVLNIDTYFNILQQHEAKVLEERIEFLRTCRVFQNCSEDVLVALAAASGVKIYDPGKDILRTGDIVKQLCLIKRGVCQVRKIITVSSSTFASLKVRHRKTSLHSNEDPLTSRSNDGSWVLDNGWMLTNPRLVNNAQNQNLNDKQITEVVDIAILATGQVFGELSVLQPDQPSQVTIHSQTMVEIVIFQGEDLAKLNVQYHSGTMNALQESLLFHNPPQQKIIQLQRELGVWEKQKQGILEEIFGGKNAVIAASGARKPPLVGGKIHRLDTKKCSPIKQPMQSLLRDNGASFQRQSLLSPIKKASRNKASAETSTLDRRLKGSQSAPSFRLNN